MIEMDQDDAAALYGIYERALKVLSDAEPMIWHLPRSPERDEYVQAHAGVVVDILSKLRAPLVLQYPDLDTTGPDGPPETDLNDDEERAAAALTDSQIALIDSMLLANCAPSWRKVARIVMTALATDPGALGDVPTGVFVRRVKALVRSGQLESEGNLDYMRFSEVRLPA